MRFFCLPFVFALPFTRACLRGGAEQDFTAKFNSDTVIKWSDKLFRNVVFLAAEWTSFTVDNFSAGRRENVWRSSPTAAAETLSLDRFLIPLCLPHPFSSLLVSGAVFVAQLSVNRSHCLHRIPLGKWWVFQLEIRCGIGVKVERKPK